MANKNNKKQIQQKYGTKPVDVKPEYALNGYEKAISQVRYSTCPSCDGYDLTCSKYDQWESPTLKQCGLKHKSDLEEIIK